MAEVAGKASFPLSTGIQAGGFTVLIQVDFTDY